MKKKQTPAPATQEDVYAIITKAIGTSETRIRKEIKKEIQISKKELSQEIREEFNLKMERRFHAFGEDLIKIFVTKDEFHEEMNKLRNDLPTRKQIELLMKSNDTIIQKLTRREVEDVALTHRLERHEDTFSEHEHRLQKLEKTR